MVEIKDFFTKETNVMNLTILAVYRIAIEINFLCLYEETCRKGQKRRSIFNHPCLDYNRVK